MVIVAGTAATADAERAERPCPGGAEERGAAPPEGLARWCVQDGRHHGPWTIWYPNGSRMREGFLHRGRMQGRFASWHKNGQLGEESFYRAGARVGIWRAWRTDGTPIHVTPYRSGKKHGYEKRYHPNGKLASSTRFRWGKAHGPHLERSDTGALTVRGQHADGVRVGVWRYPATSTTVRMEERYLAGKLEETLFDGAPLNAVCDRVAERMAHSNRRERDSWVWGCRRLAGEPAMVGCIIKARDRAEVEACYDATETSD